MGDVTEVEVLEPPPTPTVIAGHELKPREWRAFEAFTETGSWMDAARAAGVARDTIRRWRYSKWWQVLMQQYLREHQEKLVVRLSQKVDVIADGLISVSEGDEKFVKSANAVVQAVKVFAEIGEEPLINRRPNVQIQNNTFNNQGIMNFEKVVALSRLPGGREKILEIVSGNASPAEEERE